MGFAIAAIAIASALVVLRFVRRAWVVAAPDEWLLRLRDGAMIEAGIGIATWRWPGDVVVRFTSTLQRVAFAASARTCDGIGLGVDGFVLWSVDPTADAPFRAFRQLGFVDLERRPEGRHDRRHLLTTPQYHAFQRLLFAHIQRLVSTMPLADALSAEDAMVARLRERLVPFGRELGIVFEDVEVFRIQPDDAALLRALAAPVEERVREQADQARLAATEAIAVRQRELDVATRAAEHAAWLDTARAEAERKALEHAAELERVRDGARARRDAGEIMLALEQQRPHELREHELALLTVERLTEALARLPLKEARWISIGDPLDAVARLLGRRAAS
jgi:hypothetical protein